MCHSCMMLQAVLTHLFQNKSIDNLEVAKSLLNEKGRGRTNTGHKFDGAQLCKSLYAVVILAQDLCIDTGQQE